MAALGTLQRLFKPEPAAALPIDVIYLTIYSVSASKQPPSKRLMANATGQLRK